MYTKMHHLGLRGAAYVRGALASTVAHWQGKVPLPCWGLSARPAGQQPCAGLLAVCVCVRVCVLCVVCECVYVCVCVCCVCVCVCAFVCMRICVCVCVVCVCVCVCVCVLCVCKVCMHATHLAREGNHFQSLN